jgi:histidinol-phosphate/aromatic aminotransferase/cobyric acid decarboxylase-like protein
MTTPTLVAWAAASPVASVHAVESPIPITTVRLGPEVEQAVLDVIRSGSIAQGPVVKRLEDEFAAMIGVDHVVAVNNGTTALIAALQVLDLQPGDEVITSPFTFVATLNAVLQAGATVRFADIDPTTFNVDPASVAALINERTRVLLPVHRSKREKFIRMLSRYSSAREKNSRAFLTWAFALCWTSSSLILGKISVLLAKSR